VQSTSTDWEPTTPSPAKARVTGAAVLLDEIVEMTPKATPAILNKKLRSYFRNPTTQRSQAATPLFLCYRRPRGSQFLLTTFQIIPHGNPAGCVFLGRQYSRTASRREARSSATTTTGARHRRRPTYRAPPQLKKKRSQHLPPTLPAHPALKMSDAAVKIGAGTMFGIAYDVTPSTTTPTGPHTLAGSFQPCPHMRDVRCTFPIPPPRRDITRHEESR
jgi:hypothetical protein